MSARHDKSLAVPMPMGAAKSCLLGFCRVLHCKARAPKPAQAVRALCFNWPAQQAKYQCLH